MPIRLETDEGFAMHSQVASIRQAVARVIGLVGVICIQTLSDSGIARADYSPPVFTGTGAYRRVYSHSNYSRMSSYLTLPGASSISMHPGDTAFVYVGGWGANGKGAVDAGFQYSPTYNNWSLFMSAAGVGRVDDPGPRFSASQSVFLKFLVVQQGSTTSLEIIANGTDLNGDAVQRELTLQNVPGWSVNGVNTLKRMTSIAQNGDNFTDGSYINGVHWYSSMIGTTQSDMHAWSAADTGGYQSYPSTPGVVKVQYVNAGEETDSISLNAAAPSLSAVPEPSALVLLVSGFAILSGAIRSRRR
jgi:hypothetical protein